MDARNMSLSEYNQWQKKRRIKTIVLGIAALAVAVIMFILGNVGIYLGIAFACIGLILLIFSRRLKPVTEAERKENFDKLDQFIEKCEDDKVEAEKRKKLQNLETLLKHGEITYLAYDAAKAKILGTTSIASLMTPDQILSEQSKQLNDITRRKAQKQAERTVAMHTIVGGAVGGTTGAIVGAAVGKQKAENDLKNVEDSLQA